MYKENSLILHFTAFWKSKKLPLSQLLNAQNHFLDKVNSEVDYLARDYICRNFIGLSKDV